MTVPASASSSSTPTPPPSSPPKPSSPRGAWQFAMTVILLPYLMGVMLSSRILPDTFSWSSLSFVSDPFRKLESSVSTTSPQPPATTPSSDELVIHDAACDQRLLNFLKASASGHKDPLKGVSFVVHRNGEAEPCGNTQPASILYELRKAAQSMTHCPHTFDKYYVESLVSKVIHNMVTTCPSQEPDRDEKDGFLGFCDMGESKTPILLDHNQLVPITVPSMAGKKGLHRAKNITRLPCHFHTREGVRVVSLQQLAELAQQDTTEEPVQCNDSPDQTCSDNDARRRQVHLYAVPAGRMFMFAPAFVGEIFHLPHVLGADGLPVYLEVMSLSPRVFDVFNFFSKDESADLVTRALAETTESHRIKRSTTGAVGNQVNRKRTSESGFDTSGKTAMTAKRRCFKVLGFDTYTEGHSDGLQILRYNLTTAYIPHMDWIDDPSGQLAHDYESSGRGGNRFATILLYMSDLGERDGGETVFVKAWPNWQDEKDRVQLPEALEALRASGDAGVLEKGSWEEEMAAQCRTRLAIRPNSARAVLFYSQHPNGVADDSSLHGGCPVLRGEKWAANLWVWNTPREGFFGAPRNPNAPQEDVAGVNDVPTPQYEQITATFRNTGRDPAFAKAELYYDQDTLWGKLGHDDPDLGANTFEGHRWDVKVDGKIVKTWVVEKGDIQVFEI